VSSSVEVAPVGLEAAKTEGPQSFSRLAELVQRYLGCEAAVLSVDDPLAGLRHATTATPRRRAASAAFRPGCRPSVMESGLLLDPRVAGEMGMRFYAGLPLRDYAGRSIGMLAAMDQDERPLNSAELEMLKLLAGMATDLYEMQRVSEAA